MMRNQAFRKYILNQPFELEELELCLELLLQQFSLQTL